MIKTLLKANKKAIFFIFIKERKFFIYLKKSFRKDTGRTYLVIAEKYRNSKTKVYTDRTVKSLGYLDELEKLYEDPITHFREVAERMTKEQKVGGKLEITIDMNERLCASTDNIKSFGYAAYFLQQQIPHFCRILSPGTSGEFLC